MTAPSPTTTAGARASFTILSNGKAIDTAWQVESVELSAGVNKIPKARLVLFDGSPAAEDFPIADSTALIPGVALTVNLGYDDVDATAFTGVIYRQGIDISESGPARLVVEASGKAMVMTLARHNAVYAQMTDSDAIAAAIRQSGLTPKVEGTGGGKTTLVQYDCTDWDFAVMRAQVNGMVVLAEGDTVTVSAPDSAAAPVLTLTYGQSLLRFQADMDAATQFAAAAIKSVAWDPATQALANSGTASASVQEPGNISSAELAKVFNVSAYVQQSAGEIDKTALTAWSSADLLKNKLAKIRGRAVFQGSTLAKPGSMVTLAGVGGRYNGNYYVSAVRQTMRDGFWQTEVELGLPASWFSQTAPDIDAPAAAGQLPAIPHLQTGIVKAVAGDPDGEFRVQVEMPLLQAGTKGMVWARLASFYAFSGIGGEFYPEVGEEVVLAFMNNDPRYPVILGSLWSKKNPPPVTPEDKNDQKCVVTRSKLRLDFYEERKAVEISTPGGQSVLLDDQAKKVTVKDMNGNQMTMAADSVTIDSAKKLVLKAGTEMQLSAGTALSLKAGTNVDVSGVNIEHKASAKFAAEGAAQAELKAGGILTIQGALVKIN
ncbi:type VI secretion system tip protein VgrG [Niveispirillum sp. KHB5.9]|uniref:type VI secretion system tip protein VgrG n=1 Tax=Niveispirillum sp. KHB5.9 TaxID=3400269 RepID=UPI003A8A55B1